MTCEEKCTDCWWSVFPTHLKFLHETFESDGRSEFGSSPLPHEVNPANHRQPRTTNIYRYIYIHGQNDAIFEAGDTFSTRPIHLKYSFVHFSRVSYLFQNKGFSSTICDTIHSEGPMIHMYLYLKMGGACCGLYKIKGLEDLSEWWLKIKK